MMGSGKKRAEAGKPKKVASSKGSRDKAEVLRLRKMLEEIRERYRIAMECANDCIYEWHVKTGKLLWFGDVDRQLGYAPKEFSRTIEMRGKIIHPEDRKRVLLALDESVKSGRPFAGQYRVVRKDGKILHWLDRGRVIRDGKGMIHKMVGVTTDITRFKETEAALRAQTVLFSTILSTIPYHIFWKDRKSVYIGCNENFSKAAGVDQDSIQGKTDYDLAWTREQADFFRQCDREVMESGIPLSNIEEPQLRADGTTAILLTSKVPIRDSSGEVMGILGIYADITKLKEVEGRLREQEKMYRQMLDSITDFVLLKGPGSKIVWANQAFRDYYGMTNAQLQNLIDASFNEPDYTQQYVRDDAYVFAHGQTLNIPQEPVTRHDGEVRLFHTVKSPIKNGQGKIIMTVGVSRDITERKEMEKRILQTEKMSAVGQLAAGIAHEINNPLGVILGFTEALLSRAEKAGLMEKPLESIRRETLRCKSLVQNLLRFSRSGTPDKELTDLNETLGEALSLVTVQAKVANVQIDRAFAPDLPAVLINRNQIQQVMVNLFNNAVDAMPQGGLLTIRTRSFSEQEKKIVELQVEDTGKGIPERLQARIFEPFFTTKDVGKGTGLGLTLVYEIVESHGGMIHFQTVPEKGTTFFVRLPLGKTEKI